MGLTETLLGLVVFAAAAILLGRARIGILGGTQTQSIGANCAEAAQNVLSLVTSWGTASEYSLDPFILATVGGSQRPNKVTNTQTISQAMAALVPDRSRALGGTGLLSSSWYPYDTLSNPLVPTSPRVPLNIIGTGRNPVLYNSLLIGNSVNAVQAMLFSNRAFCTAPQGVDITSMVLGATSDKRVERITLKIEPFDFARNAPPGAAPVGEDLCSGPKLPIAVPKGALNKSVPGFYNPSNNALVSGFRLGGNSDLGYRVTAFVTMRTSGERQATAAQETKTCSSSATLSHTPDRVNGSSDPVPYIGGAPFLLIDDTFRLINSTSAQIGVQLANIERGSVFMCADYLAVVPGVNIIMAPGFSCDEGAMVRADTLAPLPASSTLWDAASRRYSLAINGMQQSFPGAIVDYRTAIFVVDPAGNTSRAPAAVKVRADELYWDISQPWNPPCGPWTCGTVDQTRVVLCRWRSDDRIQADADCVLYVGPKPPTARTCRKDYTGNIPAGLPLAEQSVSCVWVRNPDPSDSICNPRNDLICGTTVPRNVGISCHSSPNQALDGPGLDTSATSAFCPPPPPPTVVNCTADPLPGCTCPAGERACGGACVPNCDPATQIEVGCGCAPIPVAPPCTLTNAQKDAAEAVCTADPNKTYNRATCVCSLVPPVCTDPNFPYGCTDEFNYGCKAACEGGSLYNPTSCSCYCPPAAPNPVGPACCPNLASGMVRAPTPGAECNSVPGPTLTPTPTPTPTPGCDPVDVANGFTFLEVPQGSPSDCTSLGFPPPGCDTAPNGAVNCPALSDCYCKKGQNCGPLGACTNDLNICQSDCAAAAPLVWNDATCACDACPPASPQKINSSCCPLCGPGETRKSLPGNDCYCEPQPPTVTPCPCTLPKVAGTGPTCSCICPTLPTATQKQDPETCVISDKMCTDAPAPTPPVCPGGTYAAGNVGPLPNCFTCVAACECRKWCDPADLLRGECKSSGTTDANDGNDVCVTYRPISGAPVGTTCPPDVSPAVPGSCDPGYSQEPDQLTGGACSSYQNYLRTVMGQTSATCVFNSGATNPSTGLSGLCCCM
jgi:hypothetical protein